ncbi:hypothetical protein MW373_006519, partial [Pseudomonas aeruginosa]|nr:hypothetical protein [Pseudomonas aeruginosa]
TTCAICGVPMQDVIKPMAKYLLIVLFGIIVIALFPALSTWLPTRLGY